MACQRVRLFGGTSWAVTRQLLVCCNLSLRLAHWKCSLISEYCPGVDGVKSGIPGGLYEERKHSDLLNAAQDELNEEAGLIGGTWFALAPEGIPQDKYSRNRLHPYLVIDSSIDPNPRGQDDTEQITVEHGVSLAEAKRRLLAGDMPAPAAMVTLMAIDKLRELGYVR
jgi:hypothetical protein